MSERLSKVEAAAAAREDTMPTDIDDLTKQMSPEGILKIKQKWSSAEKPGFASYAYNSFLYDADDRKMLKRFSDFVQLVSKGNIDGFFEFCNAFLTECSRREEAYTASQCHLVYIILFSIVREIQTETSTIFSAPAFIQLERRKIFEMLTKLKQLSQDRLSSLFLKLFDLQVSKTNYPDDVSTYRDENEFLLQVDGISSLFDCGDILERLSLESLKKIRALILQYSGFIDKYPITTDKRDGEDENIFKFRCKIVYKLQDCIQRLNDSAFADILNKRLASEKRSQSAASKVGGEWLPKELLEGTKAKKRPQQKKDKKQKGKGQKGKHPTKSQRQKGSAPSVSAMQQDDSSGEERQPLSVVAPIKVDDERQTLSASAPTKIEGERQISSMPAVKKVDDKRTVDVPKTEKRLKAVGAVARLSLPQSAAPSASMPVIEAEHTEEFLTLEYNRPISERASFSLLFDEIIHSQSRLLMQWQRSQTEECSDGKCMARPHSKVACFHDLRQRVQHYYNTRRFVEYLARRLEKNEQVHHRSHHITSSSNLSLTNLLPISLELHRQIENVISRCLMTGIFGDAYLRFLREERLKGKQDILDHNKISVESLGIKMEELKGIFDQYYSYLQKANLAKISPDGTYVITKPISDQYKREIPGHVVISDTIDYFIHVCQHVKGFPYKIVLENPREPVQPSKLFNERIRGDGGVMVYSGIY